MKMTKTTNSYAGIWKEVLKAIPLAIVTLIAIFENISIFIITAIITIYLAHLYDLNWQKKVKAREERSNRGDAP